MSSSVSDAVSVAGYVDDEDGYTRYSVQTETVRGTITVGRRFSEWLAMHKDLQPRVVFPDKKRLFHRSSVKERRAQLLQTYLRDVLQLLPDADLVYQFLGVRPADVCTGDSGPAAVATQQGEREAGTVSYTHLTLPTICSV